MTVLSNVNRFPYTGNGAQVTFPYTRKVFAASDVQVYVSGVLQVAGYTVTGVGNDNGGNVVFDAAPANLAPVLVLLVEPATQETSLPTSGAFPAKAVEAIADKLTMEIQQLAETDNRSLKVAVTSLFQNLLVPDPVTGKFLRWKDLTQLENADITSGGVLGLPVSTANGGTGSAFSTVLALAQGLNLALWKAGANIVAAATITLPNPLDGGLITVTGNTGVSAISTAGVAIGTEVAFLFTGTPALTHGANFYLQGATNYTVAANDIIVFKLISATKWQEVRRVNAAVATGLKFLRDDGTYQPVSGAWTTPAYNAGNFTGGGAQTWTVDSGDVTTYAYSVVGKTMTLAVLLSTTSVGGTPNPELRVAIPAGLTAAKTMVSVGRASDNGAAMAASLAFVTAGNGFVQIYKDLIGAANWSAAANTTVVQFTITFEIQ